MAMKSTMTALCLVLGFASVVSEDTMAVEMDAQGAVKVAQQRLIRNVKARKQSHSGAREATVSGDAQQEIVELVQELVHEREELQKAKAEIAELKSQDLESSGEEESSLLEEATAPEGDGGEDFSAAEIDADASFTPNCPNVEYGGTGSSERIKTMCMCLKRPEDQRNSADPCNCPGPNCPAGDASEWQEWQKCYIGGVHCNPGKYCANYRCSDSPATATAPATTTKAPQASCADSNRHCPAWARSGLCRFLKSLCKKSCKVCEASTSATRNIGAAVNKHIKKVMNPFKFR